MDQLAELKSLIKSGLWQNINLGVNLLGEPIIDRGFKPVSFDYLVRFCASNGIEDKQLADLINKFGSAELVSGALFTTKDINTYGKAWVGHQKNVDEAIDYLKNIGASEAQISELKMNVAINGKGGKSAAVMDLLNNEEDFVRFYLLGDRQRLWRFIKNKKVTAKKGESLIAKAFGEAGIDLTKYVSFFREIQNPKIFADVCWCICDVKPECFCDLENTTDQANDNLFIGLELLATYYTKFNDYAPMDDYLALIFSAVKNFYFNNRKLKKYGNKSVNEVIGEKLANVYKAVLDSKIPVQRKLNFALYNGFRGKSNSAELDTKYLLHLADIEVDGYIDRLANEYMMYLGNQNGISTANRDTYNVLGYFDYDDVLKLYHDSMRDFSDNFKYKFTNACFNMLKEGYLQEFIKFYYINGTSYLDQYKDKFISQLVESVNLEELKQKYMQTASYKELPVPFEYLWEKEITSERPVKYPFFILARNAKKQPQFVPEILGEQMFYEEGFNGRLFAEKNQQFKQNIEGAISASDIPLHPDLADVYKASATTPKEKQRREYYAKYFGDTGEDYLSEYYDNSEQAKEFECSVELVDSDPMDDPQNAAAEEYAYNNRTDLDDDDEPIFDDDYDYDKQPNINNMTIDNHWADPNRPDYHTCEPEFDLNEEWKEFKAALKGETYTRQSFDDYCRKIRNSLTSKTSEERMREAFFGNEDKKHKHIDPNVEASLYSYLEQRFREDGYSVGGLKFYSFQDMLDDANEYLEEEEDAFADRELEEADRKLQEDIEDNGYQVSNLTKNGSVYEYLAKENTCFNALQEEGADPLDSDDVEEYYTDIADQTQELIDNGEYEKADNYLQQLMGEPENFQKLCHTAEGYLFLMEAYKTNHDNWGLPVNESGDEDSPEYIPF